MNSRNIAWLVCCVLLGSCGGKKGETESGDGKFTDGRTHTTKTKIVEDGPFQEFYADGKLKVEGTMSGGKQEGEWKSYYPNGSNYSTTHYAGGVTNGKTVTWYPNGQIRYIGYYTNGKPSGKWLIFNDKGEQVEEKEYK